jgi:hypothetical protein
MIRKLKRIGPFKFGVVVGTVYGLISLIFIPFVIIGAIVSALIPPSAGSEAHPGMGLGVAIIFCVLAPVIYAVLGFLFGALAAAIYNVVARWTGGIEFEVE